MKICNDFVKMSSEFEMHNSKLKKDYLIHIIKLYNAIVARIDENYGTFGTGYPFYALGNNLNGQLPILDEQISLEESSMKSNRNIWSCESCLSSCSQQICQSCVKIDDELKPIKVINRLPDMNLWMVCEDECIVYASKKLLSLFNKYGMGSSEVNPIQTIADVAEINDDLKNGTMPKKILSMDAHIIDYSTLYSLIERVPYTLKHSLIDGEIPYLPIQPLSYRKKWQYDDVAYNFVHDYLSSFTTYNFEEELEQLLIETREIIARNFTFEQLYDYLIKTGPASVIRRNNTPELKIRFKERINSWKR